MKIPPSKKKSRVWALTDVLDFGKHQSKTIEDVIEDDPLYIDWCMQEVEGFTLDNDAYDVWERSIESHMGIGTSIHDMDNPDGSDINDYW